jgi:hypothetical protein
MKNFVLAAALAAVVAVPAAAMQEGATRPPRTERGKMTLFEMTNYNGATWTIDSASSRVRTDWNIRSLSIHPGDRWQICARPRFRDPCIILDRSVHDATLIGVEGQIGSARPAPEPQPQGD